MPLAEILTGISTFKDVLDLVLSKRGTRLTKKIEAVSILQRAINNTDLYLTQTNHQYNEPNENLSNLWNDAFKAMLSIDKQFARKLNDKSKFWSNPIRWINNESSMELIPDLKEIEEKCETILLELEKRIL